MTPIPNLFEPDQFEVWTYPLWHETKRKFQRYLVRKESHCFMTICASHDFCSRCETENAKICSEQTLISEDQRLGVYIYIGYAVTFGKGQEPRGHPSRSTEMAFDPPYEKGKIIDPLVRIS